MAASAVEVQFGMAGPVNMLAPATIRAPRQQQRAGSKPKAKAKAKAKSNAGAGAVESVTAAAAAVAMVSAAPESGPVLPLLLPAALPAAAAATMAPAPLPKRAAVVRHALLAVRRPPSADSELSARSSGSHCSLGSRKRRKLEAPQRSYLQG